MRTTHLILLGALVTAPQVASADKVSAKKKQSKAHVAKAMKAHAANNFPVALTELQAAYALDADPVLLYAIGQVYAKLDRCNDAIVTYQAFLGTKPSPQAAADTAQAIASCKTNPEPPPPPQPALPPPSSTVAEPAPPPPRPPDPAPSPLPPAAPRMRPPGGPSIAVIAKPARSPWYTDKLGDALVVTGLVSGVIGIVLYTGASSDLDAAEATHDIGQYRNLVEDASTKRTYSVVLLAGGTALIGAGVARYVLRGKSTRRETRVGMVPAHGGGLITWSGGF